MANIIDVTGHIGGECHLIQTNGANLMVDTGFAFSAPQTVQHIKQALDGEPLHAILLTHSHYDHVGGTPFIKEAFPEAQVYASEHTARIFQKPGARKVMREMDGHAAKRAGITNYNTHTDALKVDITVADGERFMVGDAVLTAHAAPGHTRCSLCYFFEQPKLLISCETLGIASAYPEITACYVIGYTLTQDSIRRISKLAPKQIYVAHYGMLPKEGVATYFEDCTAGAAVAKDIILAGYKNNETLDQITQDLKKELYDGKADQLQPIEAFIANTHVMIARTLADFGHTLEQ